MNIETETILLKILERIEVEVKETNRKLENAQKDITDLKVGQARLEGKVETTQVEMKTLQSGQDAINAKLNTQTTWLLSLLTALIVAVLGLVVTIGKVVFFPNP